MVWWIQKVLFLSRIWNCVRIEVFNYYNRFYRKINEKKKKTKGGKKITKIKCKKCGMVFKIPEGNCLICFGDVLGKINDIEDSDKRHEELTNFINELTAFDYERGIHNAKCNNELIIGIIGIIGNWEEVE